MRYKFTILVLIIDPYSFRVCVSRLELWDPPFIHRLSECVTKYDNLFQLLGAPLQVTSPLNHHPQLAYRLPLLAQNKRIRRTIIAHRSFLPPPNYLLLA